MSDAPDWAPALRFVGPRDAPRVEADRAVEVLERLGRPAALDAVSAWRVLAFAEYDVRRTLLEDVALVPIGGRVVAGGDGLLRADVGDADPSPRRDAEAAADLVRGTVLAAVEAAVRPARRVAVLLSGGLDSSTVAAALVAVWRSLDRRPADLGAFVVTLPPALGPGERPRAEAVARHLGLPLHALPMRPHDDAFAGCDDMLRRNDLPSDDGRFLHARDRLTAIRDAGFDTVLTGDGGGEVFGGAWVSPWRRRSVLRSGLALAEHLGRAAARPVRNAFTGARGALRRKARALAVPEWLLETAPPEPHAATYPAPPRGLRGARGERWARTFCARQAVLLAYWRAWGETLGLSVRCPLLAPLLVARVAALPPRAFRSTEIDRPLLRRAMAADLPPESLGWPKAPPSGLAVLHDSLRRHGAAWYERHVAGTALERRGLAPRSRWPELVDRGVNGTDAETFRALAFPSLGAWCRARGL